MAAADEETATFMKGPSSPVATSDEGPLVRPHHRSGTMGLLLAVGLLLGFIVGRFSGNVGDLKTFDNSAITSKILVHGKMEPRPEPEEPSAVQGAAHDALPGTCLAAGAASFPLRVPEAFDAFTAAELQQLSDYIITTLQLEPEPSGPTLSGNFLWGLDFVPPPKTEALNFIDNNGPPPGRRVKAMVWYLGKSTAPGAGSTPCAGESYCVMEYELGPLSSVSPMVGNLVPTPTRQIDYRMRIVDAAEYELVDKFIGNILNGPLAKLFLQSYGEPYGDGSGFFFNDCTPRGAYKEERQTWFEVDWSGETMAWTNQLSLAFLLNHTSLDPKDWVVKQMYYNGQFFNWETAPSDCGQIVIKDAVAVFDAAFQAGEVSLLSRPRPAYDAFSLKRRGAPRYLEDVPPPTISNQGSARYSVQGNQVQWLSWDFHLGYSILGGIYFNDIRFRNQRIIYELSLQDAMASYGGWQPFEATSTYMDSGWGQGWQMSQLILGVDCPPGATLLDGNAFVEGHLVNQPGAVAIWEQPAEFGMRHWEYDTKEETAGFPASTLYVRKVLTVSNYDYIITYAFSLDGSMEVSVRFTGYIQGAGYVPGTDSKLGFDDATSFTFQIQNGTSGVLHDHHVQFKVDLDIHGVKNSLERVDFSAKAVDLPWLNFPEGPYVMKAAHRSQVLKEEVQCSTYRVEPDHPRLFTFANQDVKNPYGKARSYAIVKHTSYNSLLGQPDSDLPEPYWMPAAQWIKYSVAVSQRKDSEQWSTSALYDWMAPADSLTKFDDIILDGDSLVQEDLVAWVTLSALHMPGTEDIPVTSPTVHRAAFQLVPSNYFDENPLVDLTHRYYSNPTSTEPEVNTLIVPPECQCCQPTAPAR